MIFFFFLSLDQKQLKPPQMERQLMDVCIVLPVKPFKEFIIIFTWNSHPISITCLNINSDYILTEKMKNPPQLNITEKP